MRKLLTLLFSTLLIATSLTAISSTSASGEESTTAIAPQSSSDGTYAIGAIGPGGGFVFYFNAKGFKCGPKFTSTGSPTGGLCHYLEVAPSGWKSGKSGDLDPNLFWAVTSKQRSDVVGIPDEFAQWPVVKFSSSGIGLGLKNSIAIVKQGNDANTAAGASRAYKGGSKNDWYLPTVSEANVLCKWARGVPPIPVEPVCIGGKLNSPVYGAASAGFHQSGYSTSSEHIDSTGLKKFQHMNIWMLNIYDGENPHYLTAGGKYNTAYVRPIRAF